MVYGVNCLSGSLLYDQGSLKILNFFSMMKHHTRGYLKGNSPNETIFHPQENNLKSYQLLAKPIKQFTKTVGPIFAHVRAQGTNLDTFWLMVNIEIPPCFSLLSYLTRCYSLGCYFFIFKLFYLMLFSFSFSLFLVTPFINVREFHPYF